MKKLYIFSEILMVIGFPRPSPILKDNRASILNSDKRLTILKLWFTRSARGGSRKKQFLPVVPGLLER